MAAPLGQTRQRFPLLRGRGAMVRPEFSPHPSEENLRHIRIGADISNAIIVFERRNLSL
jgi:hypothetical protein